MDWKLIKNEKAFKRWEKENFVNYGPKPEEYPCFVDSIPDSSEDPMAVFMYKKDLEKMLLKLNAKEKGR